MAGLTQRLGLTRYEADEHYKLALQAYQKQNMDEALLEMEKAIQLLPTNSEYHAARGFFFLEDGLEDEAQAHFEQALKLHPYETLAHYGRGVIAFRDKNWDEAQAHFMDAYRSDPNRPETLYYLALTHHRKRENADALHYMQQAQQIFETRNDRQRNSDAKKWVSKLEELVERTHQQQLPAGE